MSHRPDPTHISQQILDVAQALVQTRGFNAFSYADIAAALSMTKASLHYHFATKERLGLALIERYSRDFAGRLAAIDAGGGDAGARLRGYVEIHSDVVVQERNCLCGMLAAEFETLPALMRKALAEFFAMNARWLEGVIAGGQERGELDGAVPAAEAAQHVVAALQGSMILARMEGVPGGFAAVARQVLAGLGAHARP
ncbi:MAG: TetR/AcrR family transcriptional regulator [Rhodobacteraceae bacterium]|jgi:TetR/AcrR family transcriptional repressor of nem operon|nr:TetR/AcrR family transcriptional regulator [Paracoccaceae bacterium]